jgi:hypothetical protein
LQYGYTRSSLVNGWRLYVVDSPRYFALGWKQLATEHAEVRFYRSFADVKADCLVHFTGSQCRNLIDGVNRCWLRPDGQLCRGTNPGEWGLYGPGVGGDVVCTPGIDDVPYPCSDKGRGQAWAVRAHFEDFPTDEDLELP